MCSSDYEFNLETNDISLLFGPLWFTVIWTLTILSVRKKSARIYCVKFYSKNRGFVSKLDNRPECPHSENWHQNLSISIDCVKIPH